MQQSSRTLINNALLSYSCSRQKVWMMINMSFWIISSLCHVGKLRELCLLIVLEYDGLVVPSSTI